MATILNKQVAFPGPCKARSARKCVVVRAQQPAADVGRRASLLSIAGAAAVLSGAAPALASYGDSANVFGSKTNITGFIPYVGEGFALNLPSKWNPSKEQDVPGTVLRYEENMFPVNNFLVSCVPTDKTSIAAYGSPDQFLNTVSFLLGKQSYSGDTQSEGGFAPNRVSAASILGVSTTKDKKGKEYYTYDLLSRTADGNEGGRHQLIKATVADGKLWVLLVRVGDKRWIRGVKNEALGVFDSFIVA